MVRKQKIWLGVFIGMFMIPEILFSFLVSSILFLFRVDTPYFLGKLVGEQFFIDNQFFLFVAILFEILGILGLIIFNIKFNRNKFKNLLSSALATLLILLVLIFYTAFYMRKGLGF